MTKDSGPVILLTVEEAARRLNIGRHMAYRLVMEGDLRSIKIGRLRRVPITSLVQYVEDQLNRDE